MPLIARNWIADALAIAAIFVLISAMAAFLGPEYFGPYGLFAATILEVPIALITWRRNREWSVWHWLALSGISGLLLLGFVVSDSTAKSLGFSYLFNIAACSMLLVGLGGIVRTLLKLYLKLDN